MRGWSLDLHVSLDEPEQLMRELAAIASVMSAEGKRQGWDIVARQARHTTQMLEAFNEAPPRRT